VNNPAKYLDLIVYDFDGVMTDNTVIIDEYGKESVVVNRSDGMAISEIKKIGIPQIILSTEKNLVVKKRGRKLGIPVFQGIKNKETFLADHLRKGEVNPQKVVYIGNDTNDLLAMKMIGHPICPKDAHESIKKISSLILKTSGGKGVIRELFDYLTKNESK